MHRLPGRRGFLLILIGVLLRGYQEMFKQTIEESSAQFLRRIAESNKNWDLVAKQWTSQSTQILSTQKTVSQSGPLDGFERVGSLRGVRQL